MTYHMPNESKSKNMDYSKSDSKGMGSNEGASTGLKHENSQRKDVMATPSNKNPYPHGMA